MEKLHFQPRRNTGDPDHRVLSDTELENAVKEGEQRR
jgi:hypothetical protein